MRCGSLVLLSLCGLAIASPILVHSTPKHASRDVGVQFTYSTSNPEVTQDGKGYGLDQYNQYTGDGSLAAGWLVSTDWVSFEFMFAANVPVMLVGCEWFGMPSYYNTLESEIPLIRQAIQATATTSGVDHRFILAVMMQESLGCVRVYTTANANLNPGLMQDHAGTATCNSGSKWTPMDVREPCPYNTILDMIQGGVGGTPSGDGLAAYLNLAVERMQAVSNYVVDGRDAQIHYQAARQYNSGSIDIANLGNGFQSRNCYASDIANRLVGWVMALTACTL